MRCMKRQIRHKNGNQRAQHGNEMTYCLATRSTRFGIKTTSPKTTSLHCKAIQRATNKKYSNEPKTAARQQQQRRCKNNVNQRHKNKCISLCFRLSSVHPYIYFPSLSFLFLCNRKQTSWVLTLSCITLTATWIRQIESKMWSKTFLDEQDKATESCKQQPVDRLLHIL